MITIMTRQLLCVLAVIFIAFIPTDAFSQKVKWERFNIAYTHLPSDPLPAEFTTYSTRVYGSWSDQLAGAGLTTTGLANRIKMDGFKKVDNGHIRVVVQLGYFRTENNKLNSIKKEKEDKEGNKSTYYRYTRSFQYSMPISMQVTDYQGKVLIDRVISDRSNAQTYTSKEFASAKAANEWWYKNRTNTYNQFIKELINNGINTASSTIRSKYDYQKMAKKTDNMELVVKFEKEAEFEKAYNTVKEAFAEMTPQEPVDGLKEKVKPAMEFWSQMIDSYDPRHKKERKVVHAANYNMAVTFFWLDDLDSAQKYATDCLNIGWKDGRPKQLKREIENVRKLFAANKMTTRHIKRDLSNAKPPASSAELAALAMEDDGAAAVDMQGFVVSNDDTRLEGKFVITAEEGESLAFGPNGNITFVYEDAGMEKKHFMDPSKTSAFGFEKRQFSVHPFAPGSDPDAEAKPCILESLYDSEKVNVYVYCPYDDKLGEEDVEFAFQKGEGELVSTKDTQFLIFKKGLAKYFEDCADLKELAEGGEFKRNEKDIVRAARVYAEMCD
jgi:hypothetical protein